MKLSPFCAIAAFLIPAATAAPYIDPIVVGLWYEKPTSGPDNRFLEGAGNIKNPRGPANVVGVFEFDLNGNKDLGVAAKKDFRWSSDKSLNQIQDCAIWLSSDPGVIYPYYSLKNDTVFITAATAGGFQPDPNSIHVECHDIV